jgi:hypothetical protein
MAGVEGDALLAPVIGGELNAHIPYEWARIPEVGPFPPFDLDDLRAHVPQYH